MKFSSHLSMIVAYCDIPAKSPAFSTNCLYRLFANYAILLRLRASRYVSHTCQSHFAACSMGILA